MAGTRPGCPPACVVACLGRAAGDHADCRACHCRSCGLGWGNLKRSGRRVYGRAQPSRAGDGIGRHADPGADRILLPARCATPHLLRAMALPAPAHLRGCGARVCASAGGARPCGPAMVAGCLGLAVHLRLRAGPAMAGVSAVVPALAAPVASRTGAAGSP